MKLDRLCHHIAMVATGITCTLCLGGARAELGGLPMKPPAADNLITVQITPHTGNGVQTLDASAMTASYTVRETTLGTGTLIREYVTTNNSVFGISWQGPVKPAVADLFGKYFSLYTSGVSTIHAARGIRAPVSVDTNSFVVRVSGHMGSFAGRAWLPQLLPTGVTGNDIQ